VISLDFELHWGVRDKKPSDGPYRANLLGAREAIPQILDLFEEFDVAATWAIVGFLFARSRSDIAVHAPPVRPRYLNPRLDPYSEPIGEGEEDDPVHYGASLIEQIRGYPRQEIGSHTFSHYYTLEPEQSLEAFRADLRSAKSIAEHEGVALRSLVLPRNQWDGKYEDVLMEEGITCYRGNQRGWMYRSPGEEGLVRRGVRLIDAYFPLSRIGLTDWGVIRQPNGLCNVPASVFLRPYDPAKGFVEGFRRHRIVTGLRRAALSGKVMHIWWHPHNFGKNTDENLAFLRSILEVFAQLRREHGMRSLSMGEVASFVSNEAVPV
jgi:peptidoglycan/xylan/chitin deacetylase (PgdA/CDA1 family)